MSRRSRTLEQIVAGDVATITECYRLFTMRGWSKTEIRRAFDRAAALERSQPGGIYSLRARKWN